MKTFFTIEIDRHADGRATVVKLQNPHWSAAIVMTPVGATELACLATGTARKLELSADQRSLLAAAIMRVLDISAQCALDHPELFPPVLDPDPNAN